MLVDALQPGYVCYRHRVGEARRIRVLRPASRPDRSVAWRGQAPGRGTTGRTVTSGTVASAGRSRTCRMVATTVSGRPARGVVPATFLLVHLLLHRRRGAAREHRGHPDPVGRPPRPERVGECAQAELGGRRTPPSWGRPAARRRSRRTRTSRGRAYVRAGSAGEDRGAVRSTVELVPPVRQGQPRDGRRSTTWATCRRESTGRGPPPQAVVGARVGQVANRRSAWGTFGPAPSRGPPTAGRAGPAGRRGRVGGGQRQPDARAGPVRTRVRLIG